jgi:hypothetical protein
VTLQIRSTDAPSDGKTTVEEVAAKSAKIVEEKGKDVDIAL